MEVTKKKKKSESTKCERRSANREARTTKHEMKYVKVPLGHGSHIFLARPHGKTPYWASESLDSMIGTRGRAQAATAELAELLPVLGRFTGGG